MVLLPGLKIARSVQSFTTMFLEPGFVSKSGSQTLAGQTLPSTNTEPGPSSKDNGPNQDPKNDTSGSGGFFSFFFWGGGGSQTTFGGNTTLIYRAGSFLRGHSLSERGPRFGSRKPALAVDSDPKKVLSEAQRPKGQ